VTRGMFAACAERRTMSEQDQEREQVDEAQEDIELPNEQSEEVKGGLTQKLGPGQDALPGKEKW
jgi:hypothetical protein